MRIVMWLLGGLLLTAGWLGFLAMGALEGWFRTPIAPVGDAEAFMSSARAMIQESPQAQVALVLLEDGEVFDSHYSDGLGPDTLFPVASMSKWLTAYGVMTLVEDGKIALDAPVSRYLTRWHLPPSPFDNDSVTPRRLLSHTAGFADGLGFGDYTADETVPPLEESLAHPRSSSGQPVEIRVAREPGSGWEYSGGGYLVLQLLIEEVTGMPFETYMRRSVFEPLSMTRSTYDYLGDLSNAAPSLTAQGEAAPYYRYAAAGATGLATTTHDLVQFALAQLAQPAGGAPLAESYGEEMRKPEAFLFGAAIWGLGTMLYAPTDEGHFVFGHGGQNDPAINAEVRLNPETRDGIIVLDTGDPSLASRLGFHWTFWQTGRPDFLMAPAELKRVVPWGGLGALAIVVLACFGYWRTRPR